MRKGARAMSRCYGHAFFEDQKGGSHASAREVVPHLINLLRPSSVLDIGCGVGTWLAAFQEHSVDDVLGVDGDYVDKAQLMIPAERFVSADLTCELDLGRQFDLVVSLEVAEHLPASSSAVLVDTLTRHGRVVLFSAAVPGQGGTNHINEQWPHYWRSLFEGRGYVLVDCLRGRFWNNRKIGPCYRQNMMLYTDRGRLSASPELLEAKDAGAPFPLAVVHPELFAAVLGRSPELRYLLRTLPHAVLTSAKIRMAKLMGLFGGRGKLLARQPTPSPLDRAHGVTTHRKG